MYSLFVSTMTPTIKIRPSPKTITSTRPINHTTITLIWIYCLLASWDKERLVSYKLVFYNWAITPDKPWKPRWIMFFLSWGGAEANNLFDYYSSLSAPIYFGSARVLLIDWIWVVWAEEMIDAHGCHFHPLHLPKHVFFERARRPASSFLNSNLGYELIFRSSFPCCKH